MSVATPTISPLLEGSRHAVDHFDSYRHSEDERDWTYLTVGPFESFESYRDYVAQAEQTGDPLHYAVIDTKTGPAVGTLALMRIDEKNGVIEVGSVNVITRSENIYRSH